MNYDQTMTYEDVCMQLKEKLRTKFISFFQNKENSISLENQFTLIHSEIEQWIIDNDKRNSMANVLCGKKCPYCCHLRVDVFIPELFIINNYLKQKVSSSNRKIIYQRIETIQKNGSPLNRKWWVKNKQACPFLIDDCCSIHKLRSMTCRQVLSGAKKKCIEALDNPKISKEEVYWAHPMNGYSMGHLALLETLQLLKKDHTVIELTSGINILCKNEAAESEWWNGEGVFNSARVAEQPIV